MKFKILLLSIIFVNFGCGKDGKLQLNDKASFYGQSREQNSDSRNRVVKADQDQLPNGDIKGDAAGSSSPSANSNPPTNEPRTNPSNSPSASPSASPTATPSSTPSSTATPSPTGTPIATPTPAPTRTPSPTATPTATPTPTPQAFRECAMIPSDNGIPGSGALQVAREIALGYEELVKGFTGSDALIRSTVTFIGCGPSNRTYTIIYDGVTKSFSPTDPSQLPPGETDCTTEIHSAEAPVFIPTSTCTKI